MTTHYEKIQALGNRMASNLETMGVSASFGDGGLTLADKILQIQHFTDGLLLWADKDIIQTGDTIDFYALLLDERKAVSGETIFFKGLENTQTLVANTETSVGDCYRFTSIPTFSDSSERIYLNEEKTIYVTKGHSSTDLMLWVPSTPSSYAITIDKNGGISVEEGIIKYKASGVDKTYDASSTNTNKITSTISDVIIAETMQGTTGSDGVATVSYTGKGAGLLNIKAVHGIIQSETYSILDCLFYDDGLTAPITDHWINSNFTVTRDSNATTLSTTDYATYFANMNGTNTGVYDFVTPFIIECHIISCNSVSGLQIYDNNNNFSLSLPVFITGNQDLRIENNGSQIKVYVDNVLKSTYNYSMGTCRVGFRMNPLETLPEPESIVWKNFKIMPL